MEKNTIPTSIPHTKLTVKGESVVIVHINDKGRAAAMELPLAQLLEAIKPLMQRQPIATAPMDGTTIKAWWEGDPDPRPSYVRYCVALDIWVVESTTERGEHCTTPTHWSPL